MSLHGIVCACVVIILNKEEVTVAVWVMLILCNSISLLVIKNSCCPEEDKHKTKKTHLKLLAIESNKT